VAQRSKNIRTIGEPRPLGRVKMTIKSTILLSLSVLATLSAPLLADDRTIIAAATANAVDSLRDDVASARIDSRLTVGDFLKETDSNGELLKTLERAEQVGGPRFSMDGAACQIQLQIAGDRVSRALVTIAASRPNKSPLPAEVLARKLADWNDRTFTGVGSSISGAKIQFVRPPPTPDDAWGDVSDAARKQAVDAARDDAVHKAMDTTQMIPLAAGRTVGDALQVPSFRDSVGAWLASRPVRRVRFGADHEVELTLSTPPSEFCDQVLAAAKAAQLPLPDPAGQSALYDRFAKLPVVSIGRAAASASAPTTAVVVIDIPAQPPSWTEQPLMAEGTADARGSKLKTARIAESAAVDALRVTIDALPLNSRMTIGDAVKKSPTIARAVDRCLSEARPYKVDYRADGSVSVKSSMNPRELWAEISERE
jgi:hypothetical protein